jgi:uncharacterized protein (DUF1697 family)
MTKYIALLRGINVGGHKKIIMADLRILFQKLGFSDVASYIQSGNIIFHCQESDISKLEQQIEQEIENAYGFKVPVLVLAASHLDKIIKDNPFKPFDEGDISKIFYVFLKDVPQKAAVELFNKTKYENERFFIQGDYIYLKCLAGMGKAKLTTNIFEKRLGVEATARNHKTTLKLLELAGN